MTSKSLCAVQRTGLDGKRQVASGPVDNNRLYDLLKPAEKDFGSRSNA